MAKRLQYWENQRHNQFDQDFVDQIAPHKDHKNADVRKHQIPLVLEDFRANRPTNKRTPSNCKNPGIRDCFWDIYPVFGASFPSIASCSPIAVRTMTSRKSMCQFLHEKFLLSLCNLLVSLSRSKSPRIFCPTSPSGSLTSSLRSPPSDIKERKSSSVMSSCKHLLMGKPDCFNQIFLPIGIRHGRR